MTLKSCSKVLYSNLNVTYVSAEGINLKMGHYKILLCYFILFLLALLYRDVKGTRDSVYLHSEDPDGLSILRGAKKAINPGTPDQYIRMSKGTSILKFHFII